MDTLQLFDDLRYLNNKILASNDNNQAIFYDVVPIDCLPKKIKKSFQICAVINNTGKKTTSGIHWQAIHLRRKNNGKLHGTFFDSYGESPFKNTYYKKFLDRNCETVEYNKKQIQGGASMSCGEFSILFLWYKCHQKSLNYFINKFNGDFMENDTKVQRMYKRIFKKNKVFGQHNKLKNQLGGTNICIQNCKSYNEVMKLTKK